jgi:hypothetical protein
MRRTILLAAVLVGCAGGGGGGDLGADLAGADLTVDKAASCASTFGTAITAGFGRVDGTIRAVVPPGHPTCAKPNGDHLVVQVDFGGAAYRMVVNVESDRAGADPQVRFGEADAALVGPPFAEGWHVPSGLDYVQSLQQHSTSFVPHPRDELVALVTSKLVLGAKVAVYASTSGGDSTHLIHRNVVGEDGAIVLDPDASPHYLMFAFSTQTF